MKTIRVNTARPYDVLVGAGLLSRCGEFIAAVHAPCTAAIITDDTAPQCIVKVKHNALLVFTQSRFNDFCQ